MLKRTARMQHDRETLVDDVAVAVEQLPSLRARRDRQRHGNAAKCHDEFASFHAIPNLLVPTWIRPQSGKLATGILSKHKGKT